MDRIKDSLMKNLDKDIASIERFMEELRDEVFCKMSTLSFNEVFVKLAALIGKEMVDVFGNALVMMLEICAEIVDALWEVANARIQIPVLTQFYEEIIYKGMAASYRFLICSVSWLPFLLRLRLRFCRFQKSQTTV